MKPMNVRTRMAPSPTGNLHLGTAYATLWPYLFAKSKKGKFILRIEDTDQDRSTDQFAQNIISGLEWLKLKWDEGPFYQMQRLPYYKKAAEQLLEQDKAYYCFCSKEELEQERKIQIQNHLPQIYSGKCRNLDKKTAEEKVKNSSYVIRYKLAPNRGIVKFNDLVHGEISIDSKLLGDMVIMRQNGIPLYNFAVVVDDIDMQISHVIRGEDHISNTPKQILFFESLNVPSPVYAHYPMILNQDRDGKLSKRTGSTALEDYKKDGYLPEVLVNYLALLGWSPKDDQEIFTLEQLIERFNIGQMNKAPSAWNSQKLDWLNGEYIRAMSDEDLTLRLQEFLIDHPGSEKISLVVPLIKERIKKLSDFIPLTSFLFEEVEYDIDIFEQLKISNLKEAMGLLLDNLNSLKTPWTAQEFETTFRNLSQELNISASQMFQLIRVAISGQLVTPPLFESIQILGAEKTVERIKKLISKFESL